MLESQSTTALEARMRARLQSLPGFDLEQGLNYTLNRFPFYLRVLRLFIECNSALPVQLRELVRIGDSQELLGIVHSLKGSAATLGAQTLSDQAAVVVYALRNAQPHGADLALRFADALALQILALELALQDDPAAAPS